MSRALAYQIQMLAPAHRVQVLTQATCYSNHALDATTFINCRHEVVAAVRDVFINAVYSSN